MKLVVTGGAGFIGSNLCHSLATVEVIEEIRVIDDLSTGYLDNISEVPKLDFRQVSILDARALEQVITPDVQCVVHLAALPSVPRSLANPVASHEANANGTVQVLEAVRIAGISHMIVASSSSVYGNNMTLPKTETMATRPLSPYAASKLAAEAYALAYASSFGIGTLVFRFFNVFGPRQRADHAYAAVIPAYISAALDNQPVRIDGDGLQSRDFTFVGSVCRVIIEAVLRGVTNPEPINLAYGTRTDLLGLITLLEELLGRQLCRSFTPPRAGDVRASQADNATLRRLFPDVASVSLRDGLLETIEWWLSGSSR